jgi:O-antigen/teichoic acid export membrane protein
MNFKKAITSTLFKSAGIYIFTNIINAAIPFFLMPILTRYLSPNDYGITAVFNVLIGVMLPFIGLNVNSVVVTRYFKEDSINFAKFVSSCFVILFTTTIIMTIIITNFNMQIAKLVDFPANWLWVIVVTTFAQFTISILLIILRSSIQPKTYALVQILQTIMNVTLSLLLIVILHFNWQGRIIAQTITVTFFSLISFIMLYKNKWLVWSYKKEYIIDALKFGIPLIPHALAGALMAASDRIIITKLIGLSEAGIYSVGVQIGMVIGILESSFNLAYSPWLFKKLSKITHETKIKIVKFSYIYMMIMIIIAILFSLSIPFFLYYFIGEKFYGANIIILWISLGYAFNGMYKIVVNYIFFVEKTYILAWITFASAILHIVVTYYGVLYFGMVGAGYATTFTFFVSFIMTWILSEKVYPMPWFSFWKSF